MGWINDYNLVAEITQSKNQVTEYMYIFFGQPLTYKRTRTIIVSYKTGLTQTAAENLLNAWSVDPVTTDVHMERITPDGGYRVTRTRETYTNWEQV
jgi:hypothetical protein